MTVILNTIPQSTYPSPGKRIMQYETFYESTKGHKGSVIIVGDDGRDERILKAVKEDADRWDALMGKTV